MASLWKLGSESWEPMELYYDFTWFRFWITLILIAGVMGAVQGTCAYLILAERKISAWAQDRVGPNRVGFDFGYNFFPFNLLKGLGGLGQPIADGIKFLLKEQVIPDHVDKVFYFLGPMIAVSTALMAIVVVPFGQTTPAPQLIDRRTPDMVARSVQSLPAEKRAELLETNKEFDEPRGTPWPATETEKAYLLAADRAWAKANADKGAVSFEEQVKQYNDGAVQFVIAPAIDIGVVFVLAVGSLAAYAIVLGGWSSNNKYSLIGSLRSSAQLISYEIPMGMSILGVFLVAGSLNLERIISQQIDHGWNILFQPVACLLFITSIFAECNRVPFDLPEAEQELVGGYHTEYSGMKFALFFLGEYTHMITTSFIAIALFFGGWHLPFIGDLGTGPVGMVAKLAIFGGKMILFIIFYMLIRWTIPRFRFDQLMGLAWKVMMPLALLSFLLVLFVDHYKPIGEYSKWLLFPLSLVILIVATLISLRMPKPRSKAPITYVGHPIHGVQRVSMN
ncbi:MAG: complex I subunit 1 family protein [Gemmataceae bacterium]